MKKIIFISSILFAVLSSFAGIQPGDTLLSQMAKLPDNKKVAFLLDQLEKTKNLSLQKAIEYAEEGLKWSDQIASEPDQARLLNYLGNSYYNLGISKFRFRITKKHCSWLCALAIKTKLLT
jgi:hypothetical protein